MSAQCETHCSQVCTSSSVCSESCTEDECGSWISCGQYGVCDGDPDDDGWWGSDNCPFTYNPDQANCDGDAAGDVCDSENATYVASGPSQWCHIVGRSHFGYVDVQLQTEIPVHDASTCGSPDKWLIFDGPYKICSWPSTVWDCCAGYFGTTACATYLNNNLCHW